MDPSTMVSFRCSGAFLAKVERLAAANKMDFSTYVVSALLHYVYRRACEGYISTPRFMQPRS